MKKFRYIEEQITLALKQAKLGTQVPEMCHKLGIFNATFYLWQKQFIGVFPSGFKQLWEIGG